jgi:hypothetical protein
VRVPGAGQQAPKGDRPNDNFSFKQGDQISCEKIAQNLVKSIFADITCQLKNLTILFLRAPPFFCVRLATALSAVSLPELPDSPSSAIFFFSSCRK